MTAFMLNSVPSKLVRLIKICLNETYSEHKHKDTYDGTFYTFLKISFSGNYCIGKSEVQVYISPSLFIAVNEKTKQKLLNGVVRTGAQD